jgi:hypothetical protein
MKENLMASLVVLSKKFLLYAHQILKLEKMEAVSSSHLFKSCVLLVIGFKEKIAQKELFRRLNQFVPPTSLFQMTALVRNQYRFQDIALLDSLMSTVFVQGPFQKFQHLVLKDTFPQAIVASALLNLQLAQYAMKAFLWSELASAKRVFLFLQHALPEPLGMVLARARKELPRFQLVKMETFKMESVKKAPTSFQNSFVLMVLHCTKANAKRFPFKSLFSDVQVEVSEMEFVSFNLQPAQ